MFLSDLGADVIKVEDPTTRGDEARVVPPYNDPAAHDGLYYQSLNRGARSITLNLRTPRRATPPPARRARRRGLQQHARRSAGEARSRLRGARRREPEASSAARSPASAARAARRRPGYDYLLQAYAGFMSVSGEPDAPPTKCGVSIVDFSGGILSALAS
jgi:crotonobetainyl-CoA:carnitine CoA-transferase CaiB-like acyl-CoA transferase